MISPTPATQTPATQTTPATHTTHRRGARAPALAALAAAAILLGGCGGGDDGDGSYQRVLTTLDLPAYDPEPGSDRDAFIYPDFYIAISAVDGREVSIGHKYWYRFEDEEDLLAAGPRPYHARIARGYIEVDYITHDSALLSPGRHELTVVAVEASLQSNDQYRIGAISGPIALSIDVEPRATYRLFRKTGWGSEGKGYWALMVKSSCPPLNGDWKWPTDWDCYKTGLVVASSNPAYVGMRWSEVFKVE